MVPAPTCGLAETSEENTAPVTAQLEEAELAITVSRRVNVPAKFGHSGITAFSIFQYVANW